MDTTTGITPDSGKQQTTPKKTGTLGRGRPKPDHNRQREDSLGGRHKQARQKPTPCCQHRANTGPLTIVAANMTEDERDRAIKDAREASTVRCFKIILKNPREWKKRKK